MLGTRLFAAAISVYRKFSTVSSGKITYGSPKKKKYKTSKKNYGRPKWTDQQEEIIDAVKGHQSVFITGSAGTGKTFLLKHIIKLLRKQYKPSQVFVTGPTGVAACAVRGQTLHSFAGIGGQTSDREAMLERVSSNKKARSRFRTAKALVIDEISMVSAQLFENLEFIARKIRGEDSSWGGIQVVASGDFFQLPPVKIKGYLNSSCDDDDKEFAFEADCWNSSFALQVELKKVYRQSDPQFIKFLQSIRKGEFGREESEYLNQLQSSTATDSSAVKIYPRNEDVKRVNEEKMKSLGNETFVFRAIDSGSGSGSNHCRGQLNWAAPCELALCLDARVMLTMNLSVWRKLVNGATGKIVGFSRIDGVDDDEHANDDEDEDEDVGTDPDTEDEDIATICPHGLLPIVKFNSGTTMVIKPATWSVKDGDDIVAERKQLPLTLAWALSIHKCQGMTLDCIETDLSKVFEYGMHYVVMSRVKGSDGLHITGLDPTRIKAHPKVVRFYEKLAGEKDEKPEEDSTCLVT
ncbi:ATP-dependent DNA helicase pfh1-like [Humulus lupulus]|uniref:ATP-dependent DNA helicase pfh1-like n=1 Tax=Humulus lupulus TaxID=3486 RepID=UPI002B40AB6F|nr:ATP-dependent DNA helicase pfh1-like [Humulus lupulus]